MDIYENSEGKEEYILKLNKKEAHILLDALKEYVDNHKRMPSAKKLLNDAQKTPIF